MNYLAETNNLLRKINEMASDKKKKTGFLIGNTAKVDKEGLYFTPLRNTHLMVVGGVVVYSERQAIEISRKIDGRVDYVLVDAEKKVADNMSPSGILANIERAVRETLSKSNLWIYKGNDLTVEAVDALLACHYKDYIGGLGGKKVAIIGCGNIGSKLALKLVERAARVVITRRDGRKLKSIADAINLIKPKYTKARVDYTTNNESAAQGAEILIGATNGIPAVNSALVGTLADNAIIIDVGKGTLTTGAIKVALTNNIDVYRLDITAALSGLIQTQCAMEEIMTHKMGRRKFNGEKLVAGGLLGMKDEVVVDNISNPEEIYGISNGEGDFIRSINSEQKKRIQQLKETIFCQIKS